MKLTDNVGFAMLYQQRYKQRSGPHIASIVRYYFQCLCASASTLIIN